MNGAAVQPATEEATLVARIAAGDQGPPLQEICERYTGRIYGLGLRTLGDRGMAEELVQDTFVRLWRSAGRFDPERGTARAFIFTMARRAAIDLQRRAAARPLQTETRVSGPELELVPDGAAEEYDKLILGLDIRDALGALSEKHRRTLELCYDDDLTREQIAARLGIPVGTVKTRIHYALKALKLELEERGLL